MVKLELWSFLPDQPTCDRPLDYIATVNYLASTGKQLAKVKVAYLLSVSDSPYRRQEHIVKSYSPGGADM